MSVQRENWKLPENTITDLRVKNIRNCLKSALSIPNCYCSTNCALLYTHFVSPRQNLFLNAEEQSNLKRRLTIPRKHIMQITLYYLCKFFRSDTRQKNKLFFYFFLKIEYSLILQLSSPQINKFQIQKFYIYIKQLYI